MTEKELAKLLKERHKDLKTAISDVDRRKKEFVSILLIARNKQGWTFQEIADVLGISAPRVHQIVSKASE